MDNLKYTGQFPCHFGLPVHGICFDSTCNQGVLGCLDCLLKNHSKHSDKTFSIPSLVKDADNHYTIMQDVRTIEEPPVELKDLLSKQDETLTKLSVRIAKEKDNVEKKISEIQRFFIEFTNKIKDTFNKELDAQVDILLTNYKTCKSLYSTFYRGDEVKCSELPSVAEVMNRLNNATDKKDLETQLKILYQDINLGGSLRGTIDEKILQMKKQVLEFSQNFKSQIALKPSADKLVTGITHEIEKSIGEIANNFEKNKLKLCDNPIVLLNSTYSHFLDSVIIKPDVVATLFKKWLPSPGFTLKLLYRGSKDGYTHTAFHQKCDNSQHTITVVENTYGKILGGYTDQTWNHTGGYKTSSKSILFSITDRELYPLKSVPHSNAIHSNSAHGPTFGSNHDFYIGNACNSTSNSYMSPGNTYDGHGKTREQIGGSTNFIVKEMEVFAVTFS
jgi:hypothetical protein